MRGVAGLRALSPVLALVIGWSSLLGCLAENHRDGQTFLQVQVRM